MATLTEKDQELLKKLEKYNLENFVENLLDGEFNTETEAIAYFGKSLQKIAKEEKNPVGLIKAWYSLGETQLSIGMAKDGTQTSTGMELLQSNFFKNQLELIEEDEEKIKKGEEELFRDPLLRLIQLYKKREEEKDLEKKQELDTEILKVKNRAWENFKKIIFGTVQHTSQESTIKLLESWIHKPPALKQKTYLDYYEKQREKHPTTYLPLSTKNLLEIHRFLHETEFHQEELKTISARNKKLGFLGLNNIAYFSLRHLLGSEAFPRYEECLKKVTLNGGHMANCLEQALVVATRNSEMAEREALNQLNSPLGWAVGYVYMVQYILAHIRTKSLQIMRKLVEKRFSKFEDKLAEFYTGLTSESVATYRLYNRFVKDLGAVKIDKEYEDKFIRGLFTEKLRKELDEWQNEIHKKMKLKDVVENAPLIEAMKKEIGELKGEIEKYVADFEKGKITFKDLKGYIETTIRNSRSERFKESLNKLLNGFERQVDETPEGLKFKTKYNSAFDMEVLKGKSLTIARDKEGNIVVVNNYRVRKTQIDLVALLKDFEDKPALNIKNYNRNIMQQYAETVHSNILSVLYAPKEEMEIPSETLKQGISLTLPAETVKETSEGEKLTSADKKITLLSEEEMKNTPLPAEQRRKQKQNFSPKV